MRALTGRERTLLIVAILILYAAGFVFWVYLPYTERIEVLRAELAREEAKLEAARAVLHRMPDIEARIAALSTEMKEFDLLIPGDNRVPHFLYYCWQWERATGARIRNMTFPDPLKIGSYEEIAVALTVVGTYESHVGFLASIEGMDRLVRVDSVRLLPRDLTQETTTTGGTDGAVYPTADIVTANYVVHLFVDPAKAAQAAQEEPGEGLRFTLPVGRRTVFLP
jgi:Tfp pilus assembly protein PilO